MGFVRLDESDIISKMNNIRENGELIPVHFGYESWNDWENERFFMGSRKTTLLIGGEPNHGKSQFAYELIMQLMEKHNFKIALFSTESGDVEKIFSQFCSFYIGKPFAKLRPDGKPNQFAMSNDEVVIAQNFLLKKLFVFKQNRLDTAYQTLENIYKQLDETEKLYDITFDSLVIDPVYDVDDFEGGHKDVLKVLNRFNLEAKARNRYDIMVNHVSETAKYIDKSGKRVKMEALADEFYGGKNNQRKAEMMVLVHRPIPNDKEEEGELVAFNQTNIKILKIKPDGMAKWGTYPIYFNFATRRYYENHLGSRQFSQGTFFYNHKITDIDEISLEKRLERKEKYNFPITQPLPNVTHTATINEAFDDDDDMPF